MSILSKSQSRGQVVAMAAFAVLGLVLVANTPRPPWKSDQLAQDAVGMAIGLEAKWDPSFVDRLAASDVEKWDLVPAGWRRSGNGWIVGSDEERLEVGTWKRAAGQRGFAVVYTNIHTQQCQELVRLMGRAFDQVTVNDKTGDCATPLNKIVFYRDLSR